MNGHEKQLVDGRLIRLDFKHALDNSIDDDWLAF